MVKPLTADLEKKKEAGEASLVSLLRQRASQQSSRAAYTLLIDGEEEAATFNYSQVDLQARAIGAALQNLGASKSRILLIYPPGIDFVFAFYGCLYAGAVAVPTQPPASSSKNNRSLARFQAILNDAAPLAALTTSAMLPRLKSLAESMPGAFPKYWIATDELPANVAQQWQAPNIEAESLAFLQYTSGSTASPKGVMVSHRNLLANSKYIDEGFEHTHQSISLTWLPHSHDMGLINGIIQPLHRGFRCLMMSPAAFIQSPYRWLKAISRYRVTHSGGPNFAYELCLRKIAPTQRAALDLSCWEVAFNGAEPVRKQTIEDFTAAFAPCGFRPSAFYSAYGLAEATLKVTGGRKDALPVFIALDKAALEKNLAVETSATDTKAQHFVGAGAASSQTRVVIAKPELNTLCGPCEIGEIWVAGPGVAAGYWNRDEETEQTFHAYLKDTGEGPFLRTGDLGFQKNGELFITGRIKDLIILRGVNHYPQDIELSVERSHPALRPGAAAAFSIDVEGHEQLVVAQELDFRQQPDLDEVFDSIRRVVAENHEAQAHAIALLKPGTLPKTTSGKLQRRLCRALFLEDNLDTLSVWRASSAKAEEAAIAQLGSLRTEESIIEWMRSLLASKTGIPARSMDIDQPVTRLGLDSLIAIELTQHIQSALGITISMTSFLEGHSLGQMAALVMLQLEIKSSARDALIDSSSEMHDGEEMPLSFGQQSLWFLNQIAPESAAYNISLPVLIKAPPDLMALRRAFQALANRHASLRATFSTGAGGPVQRIRKNAEIGFQVIDATLWSDEILGEHLEQEANRPFNLESGPLFRAKVFSRAGREYVLLAGVHHIVADLWSLAIMLSELGVLYTAEKRGIAAALPPCAVQYADYVRWESRLLSGPEGARLLSYWRKHLEGVSPVTNITTDRPRPAIQTYRGAGERFQLDAQTTQRLKDLSRESGATLFMILLAAFQVLIHRYAGQKSILIGSPTAGRDRAELSGLVGYFVNPVVLRADFFDGLSFRSFLDQVRQTVIEALYHSRYPFPLLVNQLRPERDPSRSPLFQIFFVLQKSQSLDEAGMISLALGEPGIQIKLGELELESMRVEQRIAQFDLSLVMTELDRELKGSFEYNTDLFDKTTIERMTAHFQMLVEEIIVTPDKPASCLRILTEAERAMIVESWNDTEVIYDAPGSLHQLFEQQVEQSPDALAIIFEDRMLTYAELNRQANQLAHALRSQGAGPDAPVGVLMERSIELVVALLAILKAGGAYMPLDPQYPNERLAFMVKDADAHIVLTQARFQNTIVDPSIKILCLDDSPDGVAAQNTSNLPGNTSGDNLAYVIYTSGSTGKPKGAMNTHRGIINRLCWMQDAYELNSADRVLQKTPFTFDVSVWEFFWPLITGASLALAQPGGQQDSAYLVRLIAEQNITTLHFVPSMLQVFLEDSHLSRCRSIKRIICSGEALSIELQNRFFALLDAELHNLYGPTEAAVDVTFWACQPDGNQPRVPIGRPIANTQIYILDKQLQVVPVGLTGELRIAGAGLARGYLNRPDLTAEKFTPNPFGPEPGTRMYDTGDLARFIASGELEYLGRADYQVKIRGIRIELGEIEEALAAHPAIRDVVVIAGESRTGDKAIVAYISPQKEYLPALSPLSEAREVNAAVSPDEQRSLAERRRYKLPNGIMIAHDGDIQFNTMDIYREIFEREIYLKHGVSLSDGDVIFDVGAHIGLFAIFANQKCKGARIYAFEPIPTTFEMLRANVALPHLNAKLFNIGLAGKARSASFNYYPRMTGVSGYVTDADEHKRRRKPILIEWFQRIASGEQRSMLSEHDVNEILDDYFRAEVYECQLKTLSEVIRENKIERIDLLKIDVEKSELDVLAGIQEEDWKKIKQIVMEVESKEILEQVAPVLSKHGFSFVVESQNFDGATGEESPARLDDADTVRMVYAVRQVMDGVEGSSGPEISNAMLVAAQDSILSAGNLRNHLQARLPEYMIPSSFVLMEKLPLTENGKVDRRALPAPERARQAFAQLYLPPQTDLEIALASIFCEILALDKVGLLDNFFELGGHSLLAAQVITRILDRLNIEVALRLLFEAPTVASLAAAIGHLQTPQPGPLNPISRVSLPVEDLLLANLDQLSDHQIDALLNDFTTGETEKKWTAEPEK